MIRCHTKVDDCEFGRGKMHFRGSDQSAHQHRIVEVAHKSIGTMAPNQSGSLSATNEKSAEALQPARLLGGAAKSIVARLDPMFL